jgi:hypothetical protein
MSSSSTAARTVYSVTEGINSPQTKKKYAYHFSHFIRHFDISDKEALLDIGNRDPRMIEGYIIRYIKYLSDDRHLVYSSICMKS